jgi:hypothetical protein
MSKRKQYLELLQAGEVAVTFKKKDGEVRVLRCSLNEDLLPPKPQVEFKHDQPDRNVHLDQIRVFDLDSMSWKSFIIDNVIMLESEDFIFNVNQEE